MDSGRGVDYLEKALMTIGWMPGTVHHSSSTEGTKFKLSRRYLLFSP